MARKRTSRVWEFFEEPEVVSEGGKDVRRVPCKLCEQQLADGGGTTNLLSHLQAKHPEEYKRCTDCLSTKKQTSLTTLVRKCSPTSPQRAAVITEKIVEFIAKDMRPLSVVDGDGFKQLINCLEPGYKVPSRTHVTSICHKKFVAVKEQLLTTLSTVQFVAVTTDIWTSRATQAYLTVTAHFITELWEMESKVLLTREMPERHTGVHISERLMKATVEWKISEKVVAVVRDNAANMVLASQLLEDWDDLPCFGHTLQLAVKAGLDLAIISRLTAMCRKIVGHFKHSVVAMGALREKQQSMNIAQHALVQDIATRWNSTYLMYERLAEQRWAVYAVIHDEQVTPSDQRHLDLKPDQWDLLLQLVVVLKPLQVATTALSLDQNVSSSLIHPVVNGLVNCHLKVRESDLAMVKRFKEVVTGEVLQRFPFHPESVAVLSAALDPRYHHLDFLSDQERNQVHDVILDKVEALYEHTEQDTCIQPQAKKRREEETAMSFLLGKSSRCNSDSIPLWKKEFMQFQNEPQTHHDSDALVWWKMNSKRFPILARLAKRYLCVPATSVPAERIFSAAGLVISNKRSSLTPENADMLIFLNKNL